MNRFLPVFLVLTTPALTHGATFYVAKTGSDSNACTGAQSASTPKLTIKAGLACLKGGDTLIIKAGTYTEGIPYYTIPSGISNGSHTTIRAATAKTVILNGVAKAAGVMFVHSRSFITFDGIIFDGANAPGHVVYIGRASTSNPASTFIRMQNCVVRNGRYSGILAGQNQTTGVSCKLSFINTNAYGNGDDNQDHGIYVTCRDVTLDGGSYYNNAGHGVHAFVQSQSSATNNLLIKNIRAYGNGSYGIGLYSGSNLRAYNNLIYGNGISGTGSGGIAARYSATGAKIYYNTIYKNTGFGIRVTGNPATVTNNIVYLNSSSAVSDLASPPSVVANNLTTNPAFVNAASSNFYLLSSSAAINKGVVVSEVTRDFVGTLRPVASYYDIGAYEHTGTNLSSPTSLTVVGD